MALVARQIPGQVQDGTVVTVQGQVPPNANKFSINFTNGPGDLGTSDVALHADVRFSENAVVRNSLLNGSWGNEERAGPGLPVQKGQPFECAILIRNDQFMVSFNGRHFTEFRHRTPKERLTHVVVKGDAQVSNVLFAGPGMQGGQPGGFGGQPGGFGQPQGGFGGQPSGPQRKNIPGGVQPGRIIYIDAMLTPNAQKFSVNLKSQEQGGDLFLHFNPRINERATVTNCLVGGSWGQEIRPQAPFPFQPGAPFKMMILSEPNQFKVAVNGSHYTEYPFRGPSLQAIQFVEVEGDVGGVQINIP